MNYQDDTDAPLVTPEKYLQLTGASYSELAEVVGYPYDTVKRWFQRGKGRRNAPIIVQRVLALQLEITELRRDGGSANRDTVARRVRA